MFPEVDASVCARRSRRAAGARRIRVATLAAFFVAAESGRAQTQTPAPKAETVSEVPDSSNAPKSDVVVQGLRPRRDPSEARIGKTEASGLAGTEGDPAKVVEDLPGVAHASLGADPLVLWGSPAGDSRIFVDGVEVPALFHGGALRSTINGDLIGAVALTPGAYGADYGRAIGGIVRVDTRELPPGGVHGALDVNFLDTSGFASASIGDRVRVALAGRYGYLDRALAAAGIDDPKDVFPIPSYGDYQAKVQIDLRDRESLDLLVLGSVDSLPEAINGDPAHERHATTASDFQRVSLRYRRTLDDGSRIEVIPWVGHDTSVYDATFGTKNEGLHERDVRWGLRAEDRSHLGSRASLAIGMDASGSRTSLSRNGSLTLPAREGDLQVFGELPGDDASADEWSTSIVGLGPYATVDWDIGPFTVTPGLRADGYLLEASRQTPKVGSTPSIGSSRLKLDVEPRLGAQWRVSRRVTTLAAVGIYSEPPAASDLSAVFGTPTLGPETAYHASIGESVELTPALSATVTGFYKWMTDLAVRDPASTPKLAQALLDDGVGRSYGVQILVRQRPWHGLSGWLAYTVSRSERRDAPGRSFRLFDQDEPEVFTAVANQAIGKFTVGARFRYAAGLPRTPVVGATYDEKDDVFDPVFGAQNSIRLPSFWQLDLRIDRSFSLGNDTTLLVYVEALNVTNHPNAEEFAYNDDYSRRGIISGLPVLGVAGVRLER